MQAGALGSLITVPFAIALGGIAVVAFAVGPAMVNSKVRNLGSTLRQAEMAAVPAEAHRRPSPSAANNE
jgi:hypothetical protein